VLISFFENFPYFFPLLIFNSFLIIFVSQFSVHPGECFKYTLEEYVFYCCWVEYSVGVNYVELADCFRLRLVFLSTHTTNS
jgi:hypothetical protein